MVRRTWRIVERKAKAKAPAAAGDFPCLHRTAHGRIFHCQDVRRIVVEFMGCWLVLRAEEFHRLQQHLCRIAACGLTRSRFAEGERIRLQDSTGEKTLVLDWAGLLELGELMESGARRLDSVACPGVAESLGEGHRLSPYPSTDFPPPGAPRL